ncbi:ATP-dependent DNA helicase [Corynebacterium sp. 13CS0277]|uniref:ATP-dependent DNA helicase n=1 Tax=Corynebacterium sp. 13CS0277 TaxID=2071994 RepID=UPI000D03EBD4|nr:ATP-dependent DNA helicase [Corynebacterium sp. 13CS0277]PRQ11459.1 ATP-dependent DNA helicase [Corynebacterium sp. 13CS0277]
MSSSTTGTPAAAGGDAQEATRPPRRQLSTINPRVVIARDERGDVPQVQHPEHAAALLGASGQWRVTGPAGSGVSTLLVDAVLEKIAVGVHPDRICILTGSKESAGRIRRILAARLAGTPFAAAQSMIRSVHGFAFAILRDYSAATHTTPPRLLTGAEHDAIIREILLGSAEDGGVYWPERVQPALPLVGFARALRDFLLRAEERGLSPQQLREWGATYDRDLWVAAGDFLAEYRAIATLSGRNQLNASELTSRALAALNDPQASALRERILGDIDTLVVDDAQNLDPTAARLVEELRGVVPTSIIGGDVEQAVFRFRGADPRYFADLEVPAEHSITLTGTYRHPTTAALVTCTRAATQPAIVADTLRRSHLLEGRAWSDHVVIVREAGHIQRLKRALLANGVPVHQDSTDMVLSEQPLIQQLLLALTGALRALTPAEVESLVLGPVGGADPVTLRRLIRGLRQSEMARGGNRRALDILVDLLSPESLQDAEDSAGAREAELAAAFAHLTDSELAIFTRLENVLRAGRDALARKDSVEQILWSVWQATGLDVSLTAVALRGGARGSQADTALDAMMNLFDMAGDFAERRPTAGIQSFIDAVNEQQLPTAARDRRAATPDAVTILTAHGVAGQQWPVVIVAGVQEDSWPTIGETGTLFGQEELVDLAGEGIDPRLHVSRAGERLAEELRLFHMALSRATDTLVVTTVDSPEDAQLVPSRFLDDLDDSFVRLRGEDIMAGLIPPIGAAADAEDAVGDDAPGAGDSAAVLATETPEEELALFTLGDTDGSLAAQRDALVEATEQLVLPSPLLAVPTLVAELRRVASSDEHPRLADQAATQLARLAHAGIHTAHPDYWWGELPPSTARPLVPAGDPVTLSPSQVEYVTACPAQTVISRMLAQPIGDTMVLRRGTLVHAAAEAMARGIPLKAIRGLVHDVYDVFITGPDWEVARLHAALDTTLDNTAAWVRARGGVLEGLDLEAVVDVDLRVREHPLRAAEGDDAARAAEAGAADGTQVRIRGRADRIEHHSDGLRIVDIKTGSAVSQAKAEANLQLATYQLALTHAHQAPDGAYRTAKEGQGQTVAGAQLVYVGHAARTTIVTQRDQAALDEDHREELGAILARAARNLRGPSVLAQPGPHCQSCRLTTICPTTAEGTVTTDA